MKSLYFVRFHDLFDDARIELRFAPLTQGAPGFWSANPTEGPCRMGAHQRVLARLQGAAQRGDGVGGARVAEGDCCVALQTSAAHSTQCGAAHQASVAWVG